METKNPIKSKTIHGGLASIVTGVALMLGAGKMEPAKTIDELGKPQDHRNQSVAGMLAVGAGLLTIKGRYDAKTRIKRKGDKE